jgi:hypothetical protein
MIDSPIIVIFVICYMLSLFGLTISALRNNSKNKSRRLVDLQTKQIFLQGEVRLNYRSQLMALNKMAIGGFLTFEEYQFKIDDLRMKCRTYEVDCSFIDALMIRVETPTIKDKCISMLTVANRLDDKNEISKEDYEHYIDKALDELKKLK